MQHEKYISRSGVGAAGITVIDAAAEALEIDVSDLESVTLGVVQDTDAGTVSITVEKTLNGIHWMAVGAAITEATFAAGAGAVVERTLSDANGMPLVAQRIRARATALAGGGVYSIHVGGKQRLGYR